MEPIQTKNLIQLNSLSNMSTINSLKKEVDLMRPLSKDQENKIMQKFRLDWNYNSNAIEGNSLDFGETAAFLMQGITAKGKPLKDYLDIRGHNDAIDYLSHLVKNREEFSERDIRALHEMLLVEPYDSPAQTSDGIAVQKRIRLGEYKRTPNHVKTITGEIHYYASPEETPILMGELVQWYRDVTNESTLHPVVIASVFHHRFTSIHPFDDGNGRMSRLLMNLIMMQYGYPPVVVKNDNKNEYYLTLSQADAGDLNPFVNFISAGAIESLELYLKGARGENIDEPSDLKKKIALFKKELESRSDRIELKKSADVQKSLFDNSIAPFLNQLKIVLSDFNDLFFSQEEGYLVDHASYENHWVYNHHDLLDYTRLVFYNYYDNPSVTYVFVIKFLDFKIAENSFSTEVKIAIELNELSYSIFYNVSEAYELNRINKDLYIQWLNPYSIERYYHQQLTVDDINRITSKIGEDFFEYNKQAFEDPKLLSPSINTSMVRKIWEEFILSENVSDRINVELVKSSIRALFIRSDLKVNLIVSDEVYPKLGLGDKYLLEARFAIFVQKKIQSIKKIFVQVMTA